MKRVVGKERNRGEEMGDKRREHSLPFFFSLRFLWGEWALLTGVLEIVETIDTEKL